MEQSISQTAKTDLSDLIRREYVLPDYKRIKRGFLLDYSSQANN
jgi:hypothetical protein